MSTELQERADVVIKELKEALISLSKEMRILKRMADLDDMR